MWLIFVLGAVLSWGCYGPLLHTGQMELGSGMRAFLCVGVAYFLMGVLVPGGILAVQDEAGQFTQKGIFWATLAGAVGAAGAACVLFAFRSGAKPIYVMPLVFGLAPVVNALVSMAQHPPKQAIHPLFFVGLVSAAASAWLVLSFKPE